MVYITERGPRQLLLKPVKQIDSMRDLDTIEQN